MKIQKGVTGRLLVSFAVDDTGSVTEVKVLRDAGYGTGTELTRAMSLLPKMEPAVDANLKPVVSTYTLPINILGN